ncbi:MAG: NAD(P)-binding domain-containing protein [Kineosporiaceae bacterium]
MRVTVIGAGPVGATLARGWRAAGTDVVVGVRDAGDPKHDELKAELAVADVAQALDGADVALLAVPGPSLSEVVAAHAAALSSTVVIDATNRVGRTSMHQIPMLTQYLPAARLYRGFCSLGWEVFADPVISGVAADLPFVGADSPDRSTVEELISALGLTPLWLGDLDAADTLDGLVKAWFALAIQQGRGRHVAFKLLSD